MRRRYDLARSDNFMYTAKVSYVTPTESGTVKVVTGFPVTRATVAFASIPLPFPVTESESSSSSETVASTENPRIYVSSYEDDGFVVTYEYIPSSVGYIEFNYAAV